MDLLERWGVAYQNDNPRVKSIIIGCKSKGLSRLWIRVGKVESVVLPTVWRCESSLAMVSVKTGTIVECTRLLLAVQTLVCRLYAHTSLLLNRLDSRAINESH